MGNCWKEEGGRSQIWKCEQFEKKRKWETWAIGTNYNLKGTYGYKQKKNTVKTNQNGLSIVFKKSSYIESVTHTESSFACFIQRQQLSIAYKANQPKEKIILWTQPT